MQTEKWQDQNGVDRYTTKIIAHEMQMLDSRGESTTQRPQHQQPQQQNNDDFDDDIPF